MPPTINDKILDNILAREGGYVDNPHDPGGPTNFGITQYTLSKWYNRQATDTEVFSLTKDVARAIYYKYYIVTPNLDQIPGYSLRDLVVDCAVNHGPERAVEWLQEALDAGLKIDGSLGPKTEQAMTFHTNLQHVYLKICQRRIQFYCKLVVDHPKLAQFLIGWIKRATEFIARDYSTWIIT